MATASLPVIKYLPKKQNKMTRKMLDVSDHTCEKENKVQYNTIQCNTAQYNATQYNTMQHNTIVVQENIYYFALEKDVTSSRS